MDTRRNEIPFYFVINKNIAPYDRHKEIVTFPAGGCARNRRFENEFTFEINRSQLHSSTHCTYIDSFEGFEFATFVVGKQRQHFRFICVLLYFICFVFLSRLFNIAGKSLEIKNRRYNSQNSSNSQSETIFKIKIIQK